MNRLHFIATTLLLLWTANVEAKQHAAAIFCQAWPESPSCKGSAISCNYCHNGPPARNSFGAQLEGHLISQGLAFPETEDQMKDAITAIGTLDADGDGVANSTEIAAGTLPANPANMPPSPTCLADADCPYDHEYAYKKIWLSFCGEPPEWEDYEAFLARPESERGAALQEQLNECLDSVHWLGKNGVVWQIGHYKIRPVGSVKKGEDSGLIEIVDYYQDYNLFVWSQIDDHDAREQLLSDYTVEREEGEKKVEYSKKDPDRLDDGQRMQPEYRVGLLTSFWNLGFYLNYTAVARVLVAQAFNAYLGLSLAEMQALNPIPASETLFDDYDDKGVTEPYCSRCHATIDPMAYPLRNYNGLSGTSEILKGLDGDGGNKDLMGDETTLGPLSYSVVRTEFLAKQYPRIQEMPEAGYVLGQRVENLWQWAEVVVNSDQFAANTVRDYWRAILGRDPRPDEQVEFQTIWQNFKTKHNFRVEAMLRELIESRAFGAP